MNKYFTSLLLSIIALISLSGCAGSIQNSGQRSSDMTFNRSDTTKGMVLYSFSQSKSRWPISFSFDIIHTETKKKTTLFVGSNTPDVMNDSIQKCYGAVILPEGDYTLYNWKMSSGSNSYFPKGNFSIPFTIFGGDVNYIGDYLLKNIDVNRTAKGVWPYRETFFIVSNGYAEDFDIVKDKFPNLDLNKVLDAVPDFSRNNSKFSLMYLKGVQIP